MGKASPHSKARGSTNWLTGLIPLLAFLLGAEALIDVIGLPLDPILIPLEAAIDILFLIVFIGLALKSNHKTATGKSLRTVR